MGILNQITRDFDIFLYFVGRRRVEISARRRLNCFYAALLASEMNLGDFLLTASMLQALKER